MQHMQLFGDVAPLIFISPPLDAEECANCGYLGLNAPPVSVGLHFLWPGSGPQDGPRFWAVPFYGPPICIA